MAGYAISEQNSQNPLYVLVVRFRSGLIICRTEGFFIPRGNLKGEHCHEH